MPSPILSCCFLFLLIALSHPFAPLSPPFRPPTSLHSTQSLSWYDRVSLKEREIQQFIKDHAAPEDDLQMALGYYEITPNYSPFKKLARAFRRTPAAAPGSGSDCYLSVGVDIKRTSPTSPLNVNFDSAGSLATTFAAYGANFIVVNADYTSYNGDFDDVKSAVGALKGTNIPVIYKDVVIHPLQVANAKILGERAPSLAVPCLANPITLGCDACHICASLVGPELEEILNTGTLMNFPILVEVHTIAEVTAAVEAGATFIVVNRRDRETLDLFSDQALAVRDLLPPANVLTMLVTGAIQESECQELLAAGYDGVLLGAGIIGNPRPEAMIKGIKNLVGGGAEDFLG